MGLAHKTRTYRQVEDIGPKKRHVEHPSEVLSREEPVVEGYADGTTSRNSDPVKRVYPHSQRRYSDQHSTGIPSQRALFPKL